MAQTSISRYYPVRRRTEDHGSNKRRKISESTRLDIHEEGDRTFTPVAEPQKATEDGVKQSSKTRQRRQRASTRKRNKPAVSEAKQDGQSTTSSLLDMIAKANREWTPPPTDQSQPRLLLQPPSPRKRQPTSEPPDTPTKIPAFDPHPPSLTSTPVKPVRTLPPSPRPSPKHTTPQRVETRSAVLVRLAREKMAAKSPSKTFTPTASPRQARPSAEAGGRAGRMAARRKLLADPGAPETSKTRSEMVANLYKLSTKDLALPTEFERKSRVKKTASTTATPKLHQFTPFEVESPTKKKQQAPAHERFQNLAQPSLSEQPAALPAVELPLPRSYQLLAEKFRCTDTVVNMLQKRKEICTFGKLQQAVQDMTRRLFEQQNLAQMKTVSPSAFIFRQEKSIPGNYDWKRYEQYQLTVECDTTASKTKGSLGITDLIKRRKIFHQTLTAILKRHHKSYLSSLTPPLQIPDHKIQRWHPGFRLDTVPDITEAELPQPPLKDSYSSASDILKAATGKLSAKVEQALSNVATASKEEDATAAVVEEEKVPEKLDPSLDGIDKALLRKIQEREASRALKGITRDPLKERQLEMLSRMIELCRILRGFFIAEKKSALPWDAVATKLNESYPSGLAKERVEEHLTYLCELVPEWATRHVIRKRKYLKINRTADLKLVAKQLEAAKQKLLQ